MKPGTLARLQLLAAEQETQALEAIRRHHAALAQATYQRGVLAAYRERLAASWQSGAVVPAAQARRAVQFAVASQAADAQIGQAEALAGEQLEAAVAGLVRVTTRRRALAEGLRHWGREAGRKVLQREERDMPPRRRLTFPIPARFSRDRP